MLLKGGTSKTPSVTKRSVVGTGSGITIVPESARHHEGYNSVKITATGQTASKWSGIMQRVPARFFDFKILLIIKGLIIFVNMHIFIFI
ncbi:hypothetical protein A9756_08180 [Bacillus cereus]|nr:hypothetical protein A9756_08180 [Bacillus cereus]